MRNVGPAASVSVGDAKSNICCSQVPVQVMHVAADGTINIGPTYLTSTK